MALQSSPQSSIISSIRLKNHSTILTPCYPTFPATGAPSRFTKRRCLSLNVSASKSSAEMANDQKRELLESYGLNPDEFLSDTSPPKGKRKKETQKTGRGRRDTPEEPKHPRNRETHKLLQVLGGKAKRMKLLSPKGMDVRPMMEVVKGATFDILQSAGGNPSSLRPGRWLDLYSGTGSVGIEALSRGCSEVHFVEMDPWVVSNILQPNLEWTGFLDASVVHTVRVENFFEHAERFVGKNWTFDYISVTPPYVQVDYAVLMDQVSKSALVGDDTFVVVEYPIRTSMLDSCGSLVKIADRRFGRTHLAIYGPQWAQKKRKPEKSGRAVEVKVQMEVRSANLVSLETAMES